MRVFGRYSRYQKERQNLLIGLVVGALVIVCCVGMSVLSMLYSMTPAGKAVATENSINRTSTSVALLTATVTPTSLPETPSPTMNITASSAGLDVTRDTMMAMITDSDVAFRYEKAQIINDTERVLGLAPNSMAAIELVGPADNLQRIALIAVLSEENSENNALNVYYMKSLLASALPEWDSGGDWLQDAIDIAAVEGECSINVQGVRVSLSYSDTTDMFNLTVGRE